MSDIDIHNLEQTAVAGGLAVSAVIWVAKNVADDVVEAYYNIKTRIHKERKVKK